MNADLGRIGVPAGSADVKGRMLDEDERGSESQWRISDACLAGLIGDRCSEDRAGLRQNADRGSGDGKRLGGVFDIHEQGRIGCGRCGCAKGHGGRRIDHEEGESEGAEAANRWRGGVTLA